LEEVGNGVVEDGGGDEIVVGWVGKEGRGREFYGGVMVVDEAPGEVTLELRAGVGAGMGKGVDVVWHRGLLVVRGW